MNKADLHERLSTGDCPVRGSNRPVGLWDRANGGLGCASSDVWARTGVFPGDPVPLIFPFLTRQGVQPAPAFIPLLICSPLMLYGFAAGRLHAGGRREIVTRDRV
jgi:hypothetical protein